MSKEGISEGDGCAEEEKPRFLPGTTYRTGGKHPRSCVVTDVHFTRNLAGEIVSLRYVATHQFLGRPVEERGVCATTIARGLVKEVGGEHGEEEV